MKFIPSAIIPRYELRELYESYCKENGFEPLGARRFSASLRERGATEAVKRHNVEEIPFGPNARKGGWKVVNAWRGVRLANDNEKLMTPVEGGADEPAPEPKIKTKPLNLSAKPDNDDGDDPPPPPPRPTTPKTTLQAVRQSPGARRDKDRPV